MAIERPGLREAPILWRVVRLHEIMATRKKGLLRSCWTSPATVSCSSSWTVDAFSRMTDDLARHYFRWLVSVVHYCRDARGVYHPGTRRRTKNGRGSSCQQINAYILDC